MVRNPLRVLDCKEEGCRSVIEEAPQIIDWLSDGSKNFFMKVLEYLDELSIPYMLRSTLVRGLDYYTDTVFEIYPDLPVAAPSEGETDTAVISAEEEVKTEDESSERAKMVGAVHGQQSALGGGGRYDGLVEQLSGHPAPACGFAIGLERVAALLRARGGDADTVMYGTRKVFFAQLGEQARRRALALVEDWRRDGIIVAHQLGKPSLKSQLEYADKIGATHTVIIGQKEMQDGTIIIRNMESGIQEIVDQKKVRQAIVKILET